MNREKHDCLNTGPYAGGGAGGAAAPLHKFENLKGPHFFEAKNL